MSRIMEEAVNEQRTQDFLESIKSLCENGYSVQAMCAAHPRFTESDIRSALQQLNLTPVD